MMEVIVNPQAGGGKGYKVWKRLNRWLDNKGIKYKTFFTKGPGDALVFASRVASEVVGVVGGDGTLNEVVNSLDPSIKIWVVPGGSANDFALSLYGTQNFDVALSAFEGKVKKVDVVEVHFNNNKRRFIESFGLGFSAEVARSFSKLRGFFRKKFFYLVNILLTLIKRTECFLKILKGDVLYEGSFFMVEIGNGRSTGGGFNITPEADILDGKMDVCLIKRLPRWRVLAMLGKAKRGHHLHEPEVNYFKTSVLKIEARETVPAHFDGEVEFGRTFELKVLDSYFSFLIPRI